MAGKTSSEPPRQPAACGNMKRTRILCPENPGLTLHPFSHDQIFSCQRKSQTNLGQVLRWGSSATEPQKVDAVYLWVDGEDPTFQKLRNSAARRRTYKESLAPQRFRDNGEMRHSLRSLESHAPWVDKVHIVHQDILPSWLDISNPRIRTIRHEEIFPDPSVLPTFNSCAIELNLHRIPGLSRRFLYFNDDLFLGRDLPFPDYLDPEGRQRFFLEPNPISLWTWTKPIHDKAYAYTLRHIRHFLGRRRYNECLQVLASSSRGWRRLLPPRCLLPAHVPQLYNRDALSELETHFPEEYRKTRAHRLRSPEDIVFRILYGFYLVDKDALEPRLLDWDSPAYVFVRLESDPAGIKRAFDRITAIDPAFICVNDDLDNVPEENSSLGLWREFMEKRYPVPSSFERKTV